MASNQLTERLRTTFEDVPLELKKIDVVRGLRWAVGSEKTARIRCYTVPKGISGPDKKLLGEYEYPRSYVVDLTWPLHDPEITQCVARAAWIVKSAGSEPELGHTDLKRFDREFDPFDLMDMGAIAPDPGREIALFKRGFINPDIWTPEGLAHLLDTRSGIDAQA